MTRTILALFFLLVSLAPLSAGDGDGETKQAKENKSDQAAQVTTGAGMIYTVEAADGLNNEMPQDLRDALSQMVNTSSEGLREEVLADGTVMVDLKGRFQSAMVVSIGADGKLQSNCYSSVPNHKCDKKHDKPATAQAGVKDDEKP